jgi:hypothetical protein
MTTKWTPQEDRYLATAVTVGMHSSKIAEKLGRTKAAIHQRMQTKGLKSTLTSGSRHSSAVPYQYSASDIVGNFEIISPLRRGSGGHIYLVKDTRCHHQGELLHFTRRPLNGRVKLCECPIRLRTSYGYLKWVWRLPSGKLIEVFEHRIVMEGIIGRELLPHESVHHINGVRDDNRPENLELWVGAGRQPSGIRVLDYVAWLQDELKRYEGILLTSNELYSTS